MGKISRQLQDALKTAKRIYGDLERGSIPCQANHDLGPFLHEIQGLFISLESRLEEQRRLHEVTIKANVGVLLDDILNHVYDSFRPLIPYDRIGMALLEHMGTYLRARWLCSSAPQLRLKPGYAARMAGSSLQTIIETRQPRIINDLEGYLAEHPDSESTRLIVEEGFRSSLTCPLIALGKPVGFLFFSSMSPGTYRDIHVETFIQIAEQISVIVEKGRLYEELHQFNLLLESEISERKKTEEELRRIQRELEVANSDLDRLASLDGLTGVANRRAFDESLEREWGRCRRGGKPISLILIDVDCFKKYNDSHGHLAGDDCLRSVTSVFRETVRRPGDLIARYGGEEFAVVLPETDEQGAFHLAERMRRGVEDRRLPHGQSSASAFVTISLGVATLTPQVGSESSSLVASADQALYAAKKGGRNRVKPIRSCWSEVEDHRPQPPPEPRAATSWEAYH